MIEKNRSLPSLEAHLAMCPYKDVRGMTTRLGLRHRGQNRKPEWVALIAAGWQDTAQSQQWLGLLSTAARSAIGRLLQAVQIPASLFWAEYGSLRQVRANQRWTPPPWQTPGNVSEELYYSGLLCLPFATTPTRASYVTLPADLHSVLAQAPLPLIPVVPAPSLSALPPTWIICHDVGQLLIYLQSRRRPAGIRRLLHDRWLTLAQLTTLNQQLLQPVAMKSLPSHRASPYLRLLSFLAAAGELQTQGVLTPKGWDWLAATPAAQFAWLWQAWSDATPEQRKHYALPDAAVGAPWPQPLVRQLQVAARQPLFTPQDLVHGMLRAASEPPAFWVANFDALHDLDQVVAQTLAEVLQPLGVVAALPRPDDGCSLGAAAAVRSSFYQMTPAGRAWLSGQPVGDAANAGYDLVVLSEAPDSASLLLDLPALPLPATLYAQAQLAMVGDYAPPPARSPQVYHRYQLTAATLARAAAAGYGLPNLFQALATLGVSLTPDLQQQLHVWHAQGRQLRLTHTPLLRTSTPAQLAAIIQERTLRAAMGEVLAPTVATVTEDLAMFAQRLQQHGYYAALPSDQSAQADNAASMGALWLAGRLYAYLGEHLALPLPPPFSELDRLLANLAPAQQAVLQAQAQQLHEQLLDLLDDLPFTPPPRPTEPAQWRLPIAQAIDAGHKLFITYFSAGRNVTTHRLIEPYWIEEHRGISYLRAYCHSAGRVLTFRLDRIAELNIGEVTSAGDAPTVPNGPH